MQPLIDAFQQLNPPTMWPAIVAWLGGALKGLEPLFELFEGPELAVGISIIMGVLALVVLFVMVIRLVPAMIRLRGYARFVGRHNSNYPDFSAAYPTIDEALRRPRYLRHAWAEFTETLVMPESEAERPVIRNTARPHQYINIHAAEAGSRWSGGTSQAKGGSDSPLAIAASPMWM